MKAEILILLLIVGNAWAFSFQISDQESDQDSPWPMLGHDPQHTGRSPYDTSKNKGWIEWKFETEPILMSSPVIDKDGTIYVGGHEFLYAINPDGTLKWVFETRVGTEGWIRCTPAIGKDGTIYVGDSRGGFYAVDRNGKEKWSLIIEGDPWISDIVIGEDGTIYFGGTDGYLYSITPEGILKWKVKVGDFAFSPAIDHNGIIYIGTYDGHFTAVYPSGEIKWSHVLKGPVREEIAISEDGTIYVGTSSGYLYAFYGNGSIKWIYYVPESWIYILGIAIGEDGSLYFAVGQGFLYALDRNGNPKWKVEISRNGWETFAFPVIGKDGTIYMVAERPMLEGQCGYLCAISPDGRLKWDKKLGAAKPYDVCHPTGLAIGRDGTVYVSAWFWGPEGSWGYLYAFGAGEPNEAPSAPITKGPKLGIQGLKYRYKIVAKDPEGDKVSYYVKWGDSTYTGWTREYASGEEVVLSHRWWDRDIVFEVIFQAKDIYDNEGPRSSFYVIMLRAWSYPIILKKTDL
jgi:outer membrane protein assembly factor BamB